MNTAALFESRVAVTVGTGLTTVLDLGTSGHARVINVELENTGIVTTSGFAVLIRQHPNGSFFTLLSGTDFDGAANVTLRFCTTTGPHELPAGQKAQFSIDVGAGDVVRFQAQVAAGTTTLLIRGTEMEG